MPKTRVVWKEMNYAPAPVIARVDAPNAAETAENVTTRMEDTMNMLAPSIRYGIGESELAAHINTRIGKKDKIVNIARKVFRIGSRRR
jgi:hypothetical protein